MSEILEIFFDFMLFFAYMYMASILYRLLKSINELNFWKDDKSDKKD